MDDSSTKFRTSVHLGTTGGPPLGRIIAGSAILLVGIALLLEEFGQAVLWDALFDWWPVFIVIAGVARLVLSPEKWISSTLLSLWGLLLLADNLNFLPGGFWSAFWPVVLIVSGIGILVGSKKKVLPSSASGIGSEHRGSSAENILHRTVTLGEDTVISQATDFRGGKLSVTLGDMTVDLRHASAGSTMMLDASATMGQITLRIPQTWRVEVIGSPTLGEIKNSTLFVAPSDGTVAPVLSVRAHAILGSIEITS